MASITTSVPVPLFKRNAGQIKNKVGVGMGGREQWCTEWIQMRHRNREGHFSRHGFLRIRSVVIGDAVASFVPYVPKRS